jgi:hypothetical protein
MEHFSLSGTSPEDNALLKIYVKGERLKGELIFSIFTEISQNHKSFLILVI